MSAPNIYILRKQEDKIPMRQELSVGDIVILQSGDILVSLGDMWDLLPGRYLDIDELKEFILYVRSGWPDDLEMMESDLKDRINKGFLSRMSKTVEKLCHHASVLTSTATS